MLEFCLKHKRYLFALIILLFFSLAYWFIKTNQFEYYPGAPLAGHQEQAIADYLKTQNDFSWQNKEGSHSVCSVENLSAEDDGLFPFYIWAYCVEYGFENGELKTFSGSSGPVKINYPNELSY
jgi:hypothetical protein